MDSEDTIHSLVSAGTLSRKTTRFQRVWSSMKAIEGTTIAWAVVVLRAIVAMCLVDDWSAIQLNEGLTPHRWMNSGLARRAPA